VKLAVLYLLILFRAYAKDSFRLPFDELRMNGSMVLYLFVWCFFPAGRKNTRQKVKIRAVRKSYYCVSFFVLRTKSEIQVSSAM
jgi:hypothetical protein